MLGPIITSFVQPLIAMAGQFVCQQVGAIARQISSFPNPLLHNVGQRVFDFAGPVATSFFHSFRRFGNGSKMMASSGDHVGGGSGGVGGVGADQAEEEIGDVTRAILEARGISLSDYRIKRGRIDGLLKAGALFFEDESARRGAYFSLDPLGAHVALEVIRRTAAVGYDRHRAQGDKPALLNLMAFFFLVGGTPEPELVTMLDHDDVIEKTLRTLVLEASSLPEALVLELQNWAFHVERPFYFDTDEAWEGFLQRQAGFGNLYAYRDRVTDIRALLIAIAMQRGISPDDPREIYNHTSRIKIELKERLVAKGYHGLDDQIDKPALSKLIAYHIAISSSPPASAIFWDHNQVVEKTLQEMWREAWAERHARG